MAKSKGSAATALPKPKEKKRNHPPKGKHGNLKLVLTEDVQYLGKQGDVVEVRPGYARNYLIPRGFAIVPNAHNLKLLERFKIRVRQAREARVADLKAMAEQIQKMAGITIEANASTEGHLYGSVGPAEISKGLKAKNLPVDPDMVILEGGHHIKETGLYAVKLALGHDIETEVKVAVIAATQAK
jgi:large subunit ribosomal protein L9